MLRVPLVASYGLTGYWLVLRVALVTVAHRRLGPQLLGQHLDRFGPAPCYLVRPGQILACRSAM
jgi:hypothetical protein